MHPNPFESKKPRIYRLLDSKGFFYVSKVRKKNSKNICKAIRKQLNLPS